MTRTGCFVLLAVWLMGQAVHGAELGGDVMIPVAAWEARTPLERQEWVLSWTRQCRARGYTGSVHVWSDDGRTLLARQELARGVELIHNPGPTYAATPGRPAPALGPDYPTRGILLVLLSISIIIVAVALMVAIIRWVLRVNVIVANQEAILAELKRVHHRDTEDAEAV